MKSSLFYRLSCLIGLAALLGPAVASAQYTATINLTAGILYDSSGVPLAQGDLVVLIADTTGAIGFGPVAPGSSLTAGSFLNGDDQIIGVATIDNQGGSLPDGFTEPPSFHLTVGSGTGTYANLNTGDPLAIVWFPSASTTVNSGESYGLFTGTPADSDEGDSWVIPPSGNALADLNFQTIDGGGDVHPEADGYANLMAVPEPSTYALICGIAALLMAFWRRRRRVAGV